MNYHSWNVLQFWVSMLIAWVWVYCFWRPYRLDVLRENLFALRGELFNCAVETGLPFDHPSYRGLRGDLNSFIRFAERMTLFRAILATLVLGKRVERPEWQNHLQGLPIHVQKRLLAIHRREAIEIANYVILGSPPLALIFWGFEFWARASHLARRGLVRIQQMISQPLEEQAREYRAAS
jgi:hypothetical protein